jgi:hypothetical protein
VRSQRCAVAAGSGGSIVAYHMVKRRRKVSMLTPSALTIVGSSAAWTFLLPLSIFAMVLRVT